MTDKCFLENRFKYPFNMQRKFMKRYLVRNSFLLFVIYMLSSIMLVSVYDNSTWDIVIIRSISIGLFALIVFLTNANIIIYYKSKQLQNSLFKNVEKKIFITGYLCTVMLFIVQHLVLSALMKLGIPLHLPKVMEQNEGWKILLLMAYLSLIQYTFIYLIQNFTLSQYEKNAIEVQLLKLKSSNAETTNQLLKQQIQPHFLFNALNTLKSLIRKNPDVAENYLINLSDFLRASFTDHNNGLASIDTELEICNNYMEMQQLRFGNAIVFKVSDALLKSDTNHLLPVFSLQPLIENALKHNIATNSEPLYITIDRVGDVVTVSNNLQLRKSIEHSTGNGLSNLKERYRIISGEEVKVEDDGIFFKVSLKVLSK